MDDDQVRAAIERAIRLTSDQPEPFRSLAFQTVLTRLLEQAAPPSGDSQAPTSATAPAPSLDDVDIAEFLAAKKVSNHPDRVVAIAYHAYHTRGGAGITTQDLMESYARARIKKPQNFPDVIASCVRKGRMVEGERRDGMKTWVITRTGEAHVERNL